MAEARRDESADGGRPRPRAGGGDDGASSLAAWYRLAGIGFEFIVAVLLLGGVGWFLDGRLGTNPWLLLAGLGIGFALGLYLLVRAANKTFKD
jgi:F0F1-type ATP synthase assembly protein I